METKIATYTEHGIRLQLIKVDEYYQIRKNRKRLCNIKWETPAKQKFFALIQQELLKTKITFNDKKDRFICNTVGGYKLVLETGQEIKLEDNEVKEMAKRYNLKKINENYYIYNEKGT